MIMDKGWAILQGSFLLADKLSLPASLSSLQKCDWHKVSKPVLDAMKEICSEEDLQSHHGSKAATWRKQLVCIVWLKLLSRENEEDLEEAWKKNTFFPQEKPFPEVNYTVLMELIKSLSAADVFARFLLCLPRHQMCSELEQVREHVMSSPVSEDDVQFFLDLWWQLWKGRFEQDNIEVLFAERVSHLTSQPASLTQQAAKRPRLDATALPHNMDVLSILLHTLTDLKDFILKPEHAFQALSICLDSLYTTFFTDASVSVPIKEKVLFLSKAMSIRENTDKMSSELIKEAQRDHHASYAPSQFLPNGLSSFEALKHVTALTQFWHDQHLLEACSSSPSSYSAFRLQQSIQRMSLVLEEAKVTEEEVERSQLRSLLATLTFPIFESSSEMSMRVVMTIIANKLEDYQSVAVLFAGEESWVANEEQWLDCLEKNQTAFQQCDALIQLASTLISRLQSECLEVTQCKRLLKVVTAVFTLLSLEDKNEALAAILKVSSQGFFGCSGSSNLIASFELELNMTFNCLIQGRAGAPKAEGNFSTAVSLVARVAFQNPKATLKSCCNSAIFNKGAFDLMSKILRQLTGLTVVTEPTEEGHRRRKPTRLLCRCLQEVVSSRSLSDNEKDQLLKFVALLMVPVTTDKGEKHILLLPQELVNTFVLPNFALAGDKSDLDLSLQLLNAALSTDVQEVASSSSHWVMECSPFPLLYILAQLHDQALRSWDQAPELAIHHWSMDTRELLSSTLSTLAQIVGVQIDNAPSRWSRALFWLRDKMKGLDWTVYFHLKPVWGQHFKNEVPSSLLTVCDLPEQEWSGLKLPQYGHGTGLLAWVECCTLSDSLRATMLSSLALDQNNLQHMGMFSKGLLVALTQVLPWCSISQCGRLLGTLKELITSGRLHVPFSLEYVEFLPLLDLRRVSDELCLSVLLLRVLQLLCGSSCSHWLTEDSWPHVARLYAHMLRELVNSLRDKLASPTSAASTDRLNECNRLEDDAHAVEQVPSQEVLFVLSQVFCHAQHIQVMMPGGQSEPLFLSSLEILSQYQAIMTTFPESYRLMENENTKHLFHTITENLDNREMKSVLQQKIAQLG
ncbi:gem-associated protein 4 [Stigmatopora nigra]